MHTQQRACACQRTNCGSTASLHQWVLGVEFRSQARRQLLYLRLHLSSPHVLPVPSSKAIHSEDKAAGVGGASATQKLEIGSAPKFETCERFKKKLFRQALQLSTAYKQGSFSSAWTRAHISVSQLSCSVSHPCLWSSWVS